MTSIPDTLCPLQRDERGRGVITVKEYRHSQHETCSDTGITCQKSRTSYL